MARNAIPSPSFDDLSPEEQSRVSNKNEQALNNSVRCAAIVGSSSELELLAQSLTPMQRIYGEARAAGCTRNAAYKLAGYTSHTTDENLEIENHPGIQKFMANVREAFQRRVQVDKEDVISGIMDAVRSAGTSTELLNAWREMGKLLGAYAPEVSEVKVSVGELTEQKLATMSAEQLAKMANMDEYILPPARKRD